MTNAEKTRRQSNKIAITRSRYLEGCLHKPYALFRLILTSAAVLLIFFNWYFFDRHDNFSIGLQAGRTYFAITSARYEDKVATLELRKRATARIAGVMVRDEQLSAEVDDRLGQLQRGEYAQIFSPKLVELFGKLPTAAQSKITAVARSIGEKVKDSSQDRDEQSSIIWKHLRASELTQAEQNVVFQILDTLLNPTLQPDSELAARLRDDVATQIPPVVREIQTGSVLVQKGQVVTPSLARLLQSQGYDDSAFPWKKLSFILVSIIVWSSWPLWIERGFKDKLSYREWVYVAIVIATSWSLEAFFMRLSGDISMAVLGMTGWLCLTLPVSLSYHLILGCGVLSAMIALGLNPGYIAQAAILSAFAASIGRMMFLNPPNHRFTIWRNLFLLGVGLGFILLFVNWGLGIYFNYTLLLTAIFFSAIWGTVVVALLPLWEYIFDVISPLRLLELSHPSQPILKRLQLEAPGTYHHTLMVGTLAEAAADKLNMNGLLVKAGAYYHDIGKLKNPSFFVENQLAGDNIHDELSPTLSALVIISHVKEGLEIAESIKLPKALRRFISEHHGTTVQKYFFEKAKTYDDSVSEEQFRYPGPRPQSKEAALVMLADSTEAAVKARGKPFESIRDLQILVQNVFKSKAEQFKDIDLTMREMTIISDCFIDVLRSMYHSREVREMELPKVVKAPDEKGVREQRGKKSGRAQCCKNDKICDDSAENSDAGREMKSDEDKN